MLRGLQALIVHHAGVGIAHDPAVLHPDDPVGVFLRQLRVVGNHDHQPFPGNLLQQIHHLDAGLRVQGAGGFVRQQDIRVVDKSPGNGHPLHLAAGHLVGLLVELIAQSHRLQGCLCPLFPLRRGDAGNGQCQLHIGQNTLMGDQIVALEHETDGMVPVGIPVPVRVFSGGNAVDDQIAAVIPVQTADDVQQCGLTGAAGAQNGHKFIVPQIQAHTVQCSLHQFTGDILFSDVLDLKHGHASFIVAVI